jgi:uncharacterized protein YecT (DUF1311 family)
MNRWIQLALCAVSMCVEAAPKDYCAAAQNQMQLNRCWAREANNAAERLTAALKKLPARARMEESQTKWAAYRDAHCAAVAALYEGGSMQPMQRAACLVRLTDARIAELSQIR